MGSEEDLYVDRNSLFMGRYTQQALGHILIQPAMGEDAPDNATVISMLKGERASIALCHTSDISEFLAETQRLVPLGEEQLDVDSAIEQLLREAGN
jgi:hypothetical protein